MTKPPKATAPAVSLDETPMRLPDGPQTRGGSFVQDAGGALAPNPDCEAMVGRARQAETPVPDAAQPPTEETN